MIMQNFGGLNKVYYGQLENGESSSTLVPIIPHSHLSSSPTPRFKSPRSLLSLAKACGGGNIWNVWWYKSASYLGIERVLRFCSPPPHPLFVPASQALVIWQISSSTHPFKVKYKIEISGFVSYLSLSELLNFIPIIDFNTHHQKDDV